MEVSSSEEEDGQINHNEEQEDLDRKLYGRVNEGDEPVQREDLAMVRLSRQAIVKAYLTPWFEEYVKGEQTSLTGMV
jgi:RNA polymerase-associated protein RTF1